MLRRHVIILGAGVSGLSAAWRLAANGISVTVLESSSSVGGLAATCRQGPYCIDYGPHALFSEDEDIVATVRSLFDPPLSPLKRRATFFYKGRLLDYPLTARGVFVQMGLLAGFYAAVSFAREKIVSCARRAPDTQASLEEWAVSSFGRYLYRTFFKPYTEQFWQIDCRELAPCAMPTHTRLTFLKTLGLMFNKQFDIGTKSLIERETLLPMYYPLTGFGEIVERVASAVVRCGGSVRTDCHITGIAERPSGAIRVLYEGAGGRKDIEGDYVISTIPLPDIVGMLHKAPPAEVCLSAEALRFRPLLVLGMVTNRQDVLNCGYRYYLDRPYNRLTELNEFSAGTSPAGENIIMAEIPCFQDSSLWDADAVELFDMCIGSLSRDGVLAVGEVKQIFRLRASHAYPVYRRGYEVHVDRLLKFLGTFPRIETLGRCGEFLYMDIDRCMRRAFDRVGKLAEFFGN